jgi:phosphoglycolate phosphatase
MNFKHKHILWDWNGTLVDDVDLCINVTNKLMKKRQNNFDLTREHYKEVFTFPVIDFYHKIGFDFNNENYSDMAEEWIAEYKSQFASQSSLNGDVIEVLSELTQLGFKQSILSACEKSLLDHSVEQLNLGRFFHRVHGTQSNEAHGKVDLALSIIEQQHYAPHDSILFGDTVHDHEVAQAVGIDCVLISNGHQHHERLLQTGAPVICDISEVPNFLRSLQ